MFNSSNSLLNKPVSLCLITKIFLIPLSYHETAIAYITQNKRGTKIIFFLISAMEHILSYALEATRQGASNEYV